MAHDVRVSSQDVRPTGRPNARLRQTAGDMVRSLLVVLAVVAAIMLLSWRPQPEAVKVVDPMPALTVAGIEAGFTVRAPAALPEIWRATSARWEPTQYSAPDPVLHLGFVTPSGEYAQVSESTSSTDRYLAEQTADGTAAGEQAVSGVTWARWEGADRRSLVLASPDVLTVVSGTGSWDELATLAGSLQPLPTAP